VEITYGDLAVGYGVLLYSASAAIAIASYRRSRCLSRYPIWRSSIIAFLSASFQMLWLVAWWVNRNRVAQEWNRWRTDVAGRQQGRNFVSRSFSNP
jgi:hypothetical protein